MISSTLNKVYKYKYLELAAGDQTKEKTWILSTHSGWLLDYWHLLMDKHSECFTPAQESSSGGI